MKSKGFIVSFLLLVISCTVSNQEPLKKVSYDANFLFKDSLELNFIDEEALNEVIIDYKCTATLDQDTLLIEYDNFRGFESMNLTFKIHKDSIQVNALRKTCMGGFSYKTIYCRAVIDTSSFEVGDRINFYVDAQFLSPDLDSIPEDSTGLLSIKGCLWNLIVWDKNVTQEQLWAEYRANKRREFFVKAKKPQEFEHLSLQGQFPDSIPKEIVLFQNLKSLKLSGTKLQAKDFELIASLKNLETLDLEYNNLKAFPLPILQLPKLKVLNLSQNQITELPKDIAKLTRLEELQLGANEFKTFPSSILKLTELKTINLSRNHLSELPKGLLKMPKLEVLYLPHNNFVKFPQVLKKMSTLKDLSLYDNPISEEEYESEIKEMPWL